MTKLFLGIGVGPGIGYETALKFAREGYKTIIAARNLSRLENLASKIKEITGNDSKAVRMDVVNIDEISELGKQYANEISVLHYNAAIVHSENLDQMSLTSLKQDIDVGITGALAAIKVFAPSMIAKQSGTILLTGGGLSYNPHPAYLALGVAKAGIRSMTEALFDELKKSHVHIASMNVARAVLPDTKEAREIGELFWKLHNQNETEWNREISY